MTALTHRSTSG